MKYLFAGNFPKKRITGPKNSVTILAKSAPHNIQAKVVSLDEKSIFYYNDVKIEPFKFTDLSSFDIVVLSSYYNPKSIVIMIASIFYSKKVVISPRGSFSKYLKKSLMRTIYNLFFEYVLIKSIHVHYLCRGEFSNSIFCKKNHKYFFSSNVITNFEKPILKDKKDQVVIGYMGRFDYHHKGLDLLLEYIIENKNYIINNNIKFLLRGPNHKNTSSILKDIITKNNLNNIIKLGDPVEGKAKSTFFKEIDLFIQPSRYEGQPQAVLESMGYGIPVLISNGTNLQEDLLQNNTGYTMDCSADLIAAMEKYTELSSHELYNFRLKVYNFSINNYHVDNLKHFYHYTNHLI